MAAQFSPPVPPPPKRGEQPPSLIHLPKPQALISDEEIRLRLVELAGSPWDKPSHQWQGAVEAMVRYVKTGSWVDPAMRRVDAEAD